MTTAQVALGASIIGMILFHVLRLIYDAWRARVEENERLIEISSTPLPNFFDTLAKKDIEDYLEDYEHFTTFGFSYFNNP